jgi:uncharacterized protein
METDIPLAMLAMLILLALFAIWGPFRDRAWKRRAAKASDSSWREGLYQEFHLIMWPLAGLCIAAWLVSGRSLQSFGFTLTGGWVAYGVWAFAGAISLYVIYSMVQVSRSETLRAQVREQLESGGDYSLILPETPRQFRMFQTVALAAGVTEEIIYRGFLIGVLALLMPLPVAAVLAVAIFIAAHAYQGWQGMARIVPITLVLTLTYVLSGSLWPGIVLHFIVDATSGAMMYRATREPPRSA